MIPLSLSASASSASGPQDARLGNFFGGNFTAATGGSSATGSPGWITLAIVAVVVLVVLKKWKA